LLALHEGRHFEQARKVAQQWLHHYPIAHKHVARLRIRLALLLIDEAAQEERKGDADTGQRLRRGSRSVWQVAQGAARLQNEAWPSAWTNALQGHLAAAAGKVRQAEQMVSAGQGVMAPLIYRPLLRRLAEAHVLP